MARSRDDRLDMTEGGHRRVCLSILSACARQLLLTHLVDRYIWRETTQEKLPDEIICGMTRNTDQAISYRETHAAICARIVKICQATRRKAPE